MADETRGFFDHKETLTIKVTVGADPALLAVLTALVADPTQLAALHKAIGEQAALAETVAKTLQQQAP